MKAKRSSNSCCCSTMDKRRRPFSGCMSLLVIAALLAVAGSLLFTLWPLIVDCVMTNMFVLEPDSNVDKVFRKTPFPLNLNFYFFNWTNPEDFTNSSVKPKFEEMGPYEFHQMKEKSNVTWNPDNGTVSYRLVNTWYYVGPPGKDMDRVTTLNPIALAAVHMVRSWSFIYKRSLSLILRSSSTSVAITKPVRELLFEGYSDPLIQMGRSVSFLAEGGLPPWDKFGWFYTRNGTSYFDGVSNIGTGSKGTQLGQMYTWNYRNRTPFYTGECGKVKGTSGEFFTRKPQKDSITFFSTDICRPLTLDYEGEVLVKNILGYKYSAGASLLDNGTLIPENRCFCPGICLPSGTLNVSACRYNSPAIASLPHFYNADPYYLDKMDGLAPERRKHEFFVVLEPNTGVPLEVSAKFQLNMYVSPVTSIGMYEHVPTMLFPMLWFAQEVQIPDGIAFKLKLLLNLPVILSSFGVILIAGGFVLALLAVYKGCTANVFGGSAKKKQVFAEQHVPLNPEGKSRSRPKIGFVVPKD